MKNRNNLTIMLFFIFRCMKSQVSKYQYLKKTTCIFRYIATAKNKVIILVVILVETHLLQANIPLNFSAYPTFI